MDEVNIICSVNKLPIKLLALLWSSQAPPCRYFTIIVGFLLPFPSNPTLFLIPGCSARNTRRRVLSLSRLVFFPFIFLSFKLLLAKVAGGQSHTTAPDFNSVTCRHHWTWTISTFIILPSTAALFLLLWLLISIVSIIHLNFSGSKQHCHSDLILPLAPHTSLWMIL